MRGRSEPRRTLWGEVEEVKGVAGPRGGPQLMQAPQLVKEGVRANLKRLEALSGRVDEHVGKDIESELWRERRENLIPRMGLNGRELLVVLVFAVHGANLFTAWRSQDY